MSWEDAPLPTKGGPLEGTLRPWALSLQWDVYPGENGVPCSASLWASKNGKNWRCVSPPEWGQITHSYRVTLLTQAYMTIPYGQRMEIRVVFSPIPTDDFDQDRAERARRYWDDPEAFVESLNPACTHDRVAALIGDLAHLLPAGYGHPTDTPVPRPGESKYPEELEAYFAAMEHHGLTGLTHLFPSAGPISRDQAAQIRKDLTDRERTTSGRIGRSPSPYKYWVTGLFPITARGHWGLALDTSTSSTRGSLWSYYGGEDTLMKVADSLCDYLTDTVAAYTTGERLQGYVLDTTTGAPRWLIPDHHSNTLIPEPRDL